MNNAHLQTNEEAKKMSVIKTLAIIGFITAIVAALWLSVQVVRLAPTGFKSLASLAEVVYNKDVPFSVTTEKNIVNSDESFAITWTQPRRSGAYTFSYACTDGVSAKVRGENGDTAVIACDTATNLSSTGTTTDVTFSSEKKRFTDVPFFVRYTPTIDANAFAEYKGLVTVVNISFNGETVTPPVVVTPATTTPEVVKEATTTKPVAATPKPKPTPVVTTVYPVSNPNGFIDLKTSYLGIGSFDESTKTFNPTSVLDNDFKSAFRFEVKNMGTKTSGVWTYTVTFPGTGHTYTSISQEGLKPNERAVVTIAFNDISAKTGEEQISVATETTGDTVSGNNSFYWLVKIVD